MITIPMNVAADGVTLEFDIGAAYSKIDGEPYDGPYTVTPGTTEQVLQTNNKVMTGNVTVKAIPQNYGLVTWNGSYISIS